MFDKVVTNSDCKLRSCTTIRNAAYRSTVTLEVIGE